MLIVFFFAFPNDCTRMSCSIEELKYGDEEERVSLYYSHVFEIGLAKQLWTTVFIMALSYWIDVVDDPPATSFQTYDTPATHLL